MSDTLRILHLEDLPDDADLVARALKKAGIRAEIRLAESRNEFRKAVKEFRPDVILSDHSLSSFDSHEALNIVKQEGVDVPFILVTATVSEDYAVSIIKDGASDYILKDRLQRLPSAILAAREKYMLEQKRRMADEALRESEQKYKLLFESNPMPMWMLSKSTLRIIAVNEAAIRHYGYSREEFLQLSSRDLRPTEDLEKYLEYVSKESGQASSRGIWRHKKKDGTIILVDIIAHDVVYGNDNARLVLANDVTAKLLAEAQLAEQQRMQQKLVTKTSIEAQERVREEIGGELHDNINQILAAAKMYLDFTMSRPYVDRSYLESSRENIMIALEEIRKLSHTLIPPSLGDIMLVEALNTMLKDIRMVTPLVIELLVEHLDESRLDKDRKLTFYRIVQEQMNNILKYANATRVTITLRGDRDGFMLIIEDDGQGFDTSKKGDGVGLRNMKHRASLYDGTVNIVSEPGAGCRLEVSL